jgi:hypothetical protein
MTFEPVTMKLKLDVQIVTFYPNQVQEKQRLILTTLDKTLRERGADADFLVGATTLTIVEEKK